MKFIHMADMHFDTAFTSIETKKNLGNQRRLEQREAFKQTIEHIKQNNIPYLFISGDLYEHEYIKQTTIDYINKEFAKIPNTKIFISPGNHDPYLKNSYYETTNWQPNVHIFKKDTLEKIELEEANIYGAAFTDFTSKGIDLEGEPLDKEKLNILVLHATLDGSDKQEMPYNPVTKKSLIEKGFDYVALGHIHKTNLKPENLERILYPGSTLSLGFDELGEHGIIEGEITKQTYNVKFIKLDPRTFVENNLDISQIQSQEELVETLNQMEFAPNTENKIYLSGTRNFEIHLNEITKLTQNEQILKIKDNTKIKYDLEKIKEENNLKGIFVKKCLEKLESGFYEKDEIEKAIEIGLETL